jgi:hypothetical protein
MQWHALQQQRALAGFVGTEEIEHGWERYE